MSLKHHTIIFVPHARARFRKWRVSTRQAYVVLGALVVLTAGSIFTTWSFFTNTVDRAELKRIRTENDQLRQTNQSFESSIQSLGKQLTDFEERTRQLAIVAGLDSLSPAPQTGIGGTNYRESLDLLGKRADGLGDNLQLVKTSFDKQEEWLSRTPTVAPVRGIITSGYGYRRDPISGARASHLGIDIATAPGRPVQAPADGYVVQAGRYGGLGKSVYISHGDGLSTRYGHLSKINVQPGQNIRKGDVIGLVGSTGKSTGYHLHYEVRKGGQPENPIYYLLDWNS